MTAGLWTAFLANFMFWTGVAAGGVVFAALLDLTGATWSGPLGAIGNRFRRFLPISFVLYFVLLVGARTIYPWIDRPTASGWLRYWPFVIRDAAAIAAMAAAAQWFSRRQAGRTAPTVVFLITYAVAFSVLAVDLVMSLTAPWGSTLFPAYLFTANVYTAIAFVAIVSRWGRSYAGTALTEQRACDVGKLLLGFALLWMYLVWSQFLVIWYGNLSEEVPYLMRLLYGRWRVLAWGTWLARFALPVIVLLPGVGKKPAPVVVAAIIITAGFWAECFLLVTAAASGMPSFWEAAVVSLAFGAVFHLTTRG